MLLADKQQILQEIPLFAELSDEQRSLIKERITLRQYKRGQVIYREADPANAFYCVILGRVVIYTADSQGNDTILEYLHRGRYFGIISLLTGEPHSVSARCINDSLILAIDKDDFDFILNKAPQLAIDLSRSLSRRLKRKDIHQKTIFESAIISVFSSYSQAGKSVYAMNLALSLRTETRKSAIIAEIAPADKTHSMPQRLEIEGCRFFDLSQRVDFSATDKDFIFKSRFGIDLICLGYLPQQEACTQGLINILSLLVNDYHYIILDLPSLMDRAVFGILNQSDLIHILTSPLPLDLKRTRKLISRLKEEFDFPAAKIKVIINEYTLSRLTHQQQRAQLEQDIFATLPKIDLVSPSYLALEQPRCEYAKALRRISRSLGDCLVGLALGVGLAYGLCHIGVLKVIEEEKIPIDVICGSSVGALIAALWVTGRSSEEILQIAKEFRDPKHIWGLVDFTFPALGFIKGNKLYNFLKRYLGNKTFYDVKLPLKIIASDVKKKQARVLDKGMLADAIMFSCSMPGVFRPFKIKEEVLFDAGVVYPLPTEPLFKMGVNKIIAVNVTPERDNMVNQYEKIKQRIKATPVKAQEKKRFSPLGYLKARFGINILDIIFSSIELMQSEMAKKEAELADIVLHPDTSGLFWMELHRAEDFAKRGEQEARNNIEKIRQIINE